MKNRAGDFLFIISVYIAAAILGILIFRITPHMTLFIRILSADVCSTIFVFLAGCAVRNASVYDPYWSVQPIVILTALTFYLKAFTPGAFLLLAVIWFWGIRLTANWAHTFRSLSMQDWRYDMFQKKFPRLFPLVSLMGIHMFPTIIVFFAILPAVRFLERSTVNFITLLGALLCLGAAFLQLVSDRQMHRFRLKNSGKNQLIREGVWKFSRHPNYLGEIIMWWGVYIILLSAQPSFWYLGIGALANHLMFLVISIPMADKRNQTREGFEQYMQVTRNLLPLPREMEEEEIEI